MTYDQMAVLSVVALFLGMLGVAIIERIAYFICQFRVVRCSKLSELNKVIEQLTFDNDLLRQGILITADKSGQIKFDLPAFEPEYVYIPALYKGEQGYMKWLAVDWLERQKDKVLVKRRKNYLWVDEPLPNDHIIEEPFEWIPDEKQPKVVRKGRRKKLAVQVN